MVTCIDIDTQTLVNSPGYIYKDTELYYTAKYSFENSLEPPQMIPDAVNRFLIIVHFLPKNIDPVITHQTRWTRQPCTE